MKTIGLRRTSSERTPSSSTSSRRSKSLLISTERCTIDRNQSTFAIWRGVGSNQIVPRQDEKMSICSSVNRSTNALHHSQTLVHSLLRIYTNRLQPRKTYTVSYLKRKCKPILWGNTIWIDAKNSSHAHHRTNEGSKGVWNYRHIGSDKNTIDTGILHVRS